MSRFLKQEAEKGPFWPATPWHERRNAISIPRTTQSVKNEDPSMSKGTTKGEADEKEIKKEEGDEMGFKKEESAKTPTKKEQSGEEQPRISRKEASRRSRSPDWLPERARRGSGAEIMDDKSISRAERNAERRKAAKKVVPPRALFRG
ncbi:MAG: hypothetical protein LQ346_008568 [Caloplaca aetnensis]|nr:MAG: hypothetical protein LQ346_008568 [Caloplaca aetnensis]